MTPFDYATNVLTSREDIFDEMTENEYVPFVINRHLSYFPDVVLYANDMNVFNLLDKKAQYHYFLNTIPKRRRFSKWEKKEGSELIDAISQLLQVNKIRAQEIAQLLPEDIKQNITTMDSSDGKRSTKSSRGVSKTPRRLSKGKGNT